jgi:hypothetical protein
MIRQLFLLVAFVAFAISTPLDPCEPYANIDGLVAGGSNVPLGRHPFMAAIRNPANNIFNGATIINARYVLTAATVTQGVANNGLRIIVGTINLTTGGVTHSSIRIVRHPQFNANSYAANIAVVQISGSFTWNSNVGPIPMGTTRVGGGVNAMIIGWGGQPLAGGSNTLLQLATTTLTNADCQNRASPNDRPFIFEDKMCTFNNGPSG